MNQPRVLIVRTAGTNCDQETAHAFQLAGAEVSLIHTNQLLAKPRMLSEHHVFVIPGGFTYGDDIAAGRVLANELRAFLHEDIVRHVQKGGLVLGVCNGFQALVKTGLLPGFDGAEQASNAGDMRCESSRHGQGGKDDSRHGHGGNKFSRHGRGRKKAPGEGDSPDAALGKHTSSAAGGPAGGGKSPLDKGDSNYAHLRQVVTLAFNDSNRFEDRWVYLKVCSKKSEFIDSDVDVVYLPVAHGEGKFVPLDESVLTRLEAQNQIVLRYCLPPGMATLEKKVQYPHNPNGSIDDIAGICDPTGRILGLMPHPERHVHPTSHPRWTREGLRETPDGLMFFLRAVDYVRRSLL